MTNFIVIALSYLCQNAYGTWSHTILLSACFFKNVDFGPYSKDYEWRILKIMYAYGILQAYNKVCYIV